MHRATFAAKFWTTRLVMLWHRGVTWPNFLTIAGTALRRVGTSLGFFPVLGLVKAGGVLMS